MQKAKETASNIAASAKAGMDKTKATMQEKVEKMSAHDPIEKEMATEKKQEKINQAEWNKQETRQHNAAGMGGGTGTFTHSTTGATGQPMGGHQMSALPGHGTGQPMGGHQMSALPGHGTGQPMGHVTEGVVGSHPIGTNTGTGRTTGHNTHVGGGDPKTGYGTGGALL